MIGSNNIRCKIWFTFKAKKRLMNTLHAASKIKITHSVQCKPVSVQHVTVCVKIAAHDTV